MLSVPSLIPPAMAVGSVSVSSSVIAGGRDRVAPAVASVTNFAWCRVAAKAGFRSEGIRRSAALHAEGWHDMHVHTFVAEEAQDPQ